MPKTKQTLHGSIFVRQGSNKLYIKFKGVNRSTGLDDTPDNRKVAKEMLRQLNAKRYLTGALQYAHRPTIEERWSEYKVAKISALEPKTQKGYETAYKAVLVSHADKICSVESLRHAIHEFIGTTSISNVSINVYLRSISAFVHWLERKGCIDMFRDYQDFYRKTRKKIVQTWSDDELRTMYRYFKKTDYEFYLLLRFLELTGLRISEALGITWSSIKGQTIVSKDKTRTDRLTLSTHALSIIKELKLLAKQQPREHEHIFRWQPSSSSRLTRTLNTGLAEAGIAKNGRAFHTFRKTFSTRLFQNNLSIADIKDLMRHSSIQTTLDHYKEHRTQQLASVLNTVQFVEE